MLLSLLLLASRLGIHPPWREGDFCPWGYIPTMHLVANVHKNVHLVFQFVFISSGPKPMAAKGSVS